MAKAKAKAKANAPAGKRRRKSNIILVIVFVLGLCVMLYPSFSNYWNATRSTQVIVNYTKMTSGTDSELLEQAYQDALEYNARLAESGFGSKPSESQMKEYDSLLDLDESGMMGYIEINSLGVSLPIYHGAEDSVLQIAVGHLEWSSLPVGGETSHCVLSGHRGLPSAKLFTDIDKLQPGDTFVLNILNRSFTYEVDQIDTVLPDDLENLTLTDGQDYCTLVTCTPYGVNTHRLLVRGHRIPGALDAKVVADAVTVNPLVIAGIFALPLLIVAFFLLRRRKNQEPLGRLAL